jgi:hypothetical protein
MNNKLSLPRLALCAALIAAALPARAFEAYRLTTPAQAVKLDGVPDEALWQAAPLHERFYETQPADKIAAKERTEVRLAYDERYLYIAVKAWDSAPGQIRAPFARRDKASSDQDYIGLFLDPSGAGKAAQMIYLNARGALSDGSYSDTGGEDMAPDFDVEAATARFDGGWSAELRIPFAAIPYSAADAGAWKLLVMRNMTREQRYRMYSSPVTRTTNCSLCYAEPVSGLAQLPTGLSWSATPQLVSRRTREQLEGGPRTSKTDHALSLDVKVRPDSASIVDIAINPDFSQVELDAPQLAGNTRFGLFVTEKRPFFLEGSDMLQSPFRAINTRTIANPAWGVRYTRRAPGRDLTLLSARDAGGSMVALPNAYYTAYAPQDGSSQATLARANFKLGALTIGALGTDRTLDDNRGYNRVLGTDFAWQRTGAQRMRGQLLLSATTAQADAQGRLMRGPRSNGHAAFLDIDHAEDNWSAHVGLEDVSDGFRADNGFFAQVGYRDINTLMIRKLGQRGPLNDLNVYVFGSHKVDSDGQVILANSSVGAWMSGPYDSELDVHVRPLMRTRLAQGGEALGTVRAGFRLGITPGAALARLQFEIEGGDQLDVAGSRVGKGATMSAYARLRVSDRIEFEPTWFASFTDASGGEADGRRLYSEQAAQLNGIFHLGARDSVRMILQKSRTRRDPTLYAVALPASSDSETASVVYGHTASLGTAAYAGLTLARGVTPGYSPLRRQNEVFVKLSWQL